MCLQFASMEYTDLLSHYGSIAAIARAVNISRPSIHGWKARGIPPLRQVQIENLTEGKLKAAPDVYEKPSTRWKELSA